MSERAELIERLRSLGPTPSIFGVREAASLLERDGAEIARLRGAMQRQATSAIALANATKVISGHELDRARQMRAESQPELIESERAANARLTEELDATRAALAEARAENEALRKDAERYRWLRDAVSLAAG